MLKPFNHWLLPLLLGTLSAQAWAETDTAANPEAIQIYQDNCAGCHGQQRTGGMGPALLPESLSRLKKQEALNVILHGRALTQMPAFGNQIAEEKLNRLVDLIYTPPAEPLSFTAADIQASRVHYPQPDNDKPMFSADPQNLFIVVELGDHSATLLDGDTFTPITRFKTRFALHGGPKFSPDGRYVYFASRDGWISKYDIYNMAWLAEVRVGINTRNLAISDDGQYLMAANYLPGNLVLLNSKDLSLIDIIPASSNGDNSRVSAVYTAPPRGSFIAAMKDIAEVWELTPGEDGAQVRKIATQDYLDDFFFDQDYQHLIGSSRKGDSATVLNLDSGKETARLDIKGMPHLGSGITWKYQDTEVLMSPNLKDSRLTIIDMKNWKTIKEIDTQGPGFFARSHDGSPYAWSDVFFGPNRDVINIIDKETLSIVKTLKPMPGKTSGHVEFTRDGRYALLSIWEDDGELIVYDAKTLEEVKRLPMKKPSGKYNVYNKTRYVRGTSH
ncbi:cytochrome D1 domain-containing protein [Thalassolituus sp. LLYu03]|uniref:cytochrome D1 domain-containing protein n=1 Tax=Thalassolituus sp. LLYu03 TaxID=3421656 RepID=UPI003D2DFD4F